MTKRKSKLLSRAAIQKVEDRTPVDIEVPEWGGLIRLRPQSAKGRVAFREFCREHPDRPLGTLALIFAAEDAHGAPLFTTEDLDWLEEKSGAAIHRLDPTLREVIGIGKGEEAKDDAKNASGETASDSSPTVSP